MKRLLLLAQLFISLLGSSQTYNTNQIFKDKTNRTFIVKRAKFDSTNPTSKDLAQQTNISAKFENYENNIKCTWTYLETKAVIPDSLRNKLTHKLDDLINLYKGITIEFELNQDGKFIKLLNFVDCQTQIEKAYIRYYQNTNVKMDSAMLMKIKNMIKPTYANEQNLIGIYFKEIFLYFSILGETFEKGIGIESKNFLPNPFGGEQIPVTDQIGIIAVNDSILTIENNEQPISKEFNRIMKEMINKLSKQGKNTIKKDEIPDIKITSKTSYFYNLNKKQLLKVVLNKTSKVNDRIQTENLEVTLKI